MTTTGAEQHLRELLREAIEELADYGADPSTCPYYTGTGSKVCISCFRDEPECQTGHPGGEGYIGERARAFLGITIDADGNWVDASERAL